jgi:hypothetical protein
LVIAISDSTGTVVEHLSYEVWAEAQRDRSG